MSASVSLPLPAGWTWSTIGGVTESRIPQQGPKESGSFTYVDISSVDNTYKQISGQKSLTASEAPTRARQNLRSGDVIVSMTRPNLNAVALVPKALDGAIGSTGFDVLRTQVVDSRWLYYFVQTPQFIRAMSSKVLGVLYPAVRPKAIREYPLPIAPLTEQRRVIEAIETRFTRLDAAVKALERTRANLRRYRASLLSGCFPEEDANGAHAAYVELSSVCSTATGGTPRRANPEYFNGDIPWVKSGELNDGLVTNVTERISQAALDHSNAKVFPEGTVCMALYGATVGRLGVLGLRAATNQAICAFFPDERLRRWYLFWFLRSVRSKLLNQRSGGAQPNISQTIVRALKLPLLPLSKQDQVVSEIELRSSIVDEVTSEVERVLAGLAHMRDSILKTAFEGRLVPQDPSEEPASALLERIRRSRPPSSAPAIRTRKMAVAP